MKKKKILRVATITLLGIINAVIVFFLVLFLAQYRPEDYETISAGQSGEKSVSVGDTVKVMTWNIGYGALDATADFFMDGGVMVDTASTEDVYNNIESISKVIENENPDIVLLQEVDRDSKRSHHVDELDYFKKNLEEYNSTFAYNFKVLYIPYPIPNLGEVNSGVATLEKYSITDSQRIQLYCPFNKFVRAFNLRRCLMVNRIPIEDSDKELVVVNLHLEAYDSGEGKIKQTKQLEEFIEGEYEKGNYVIAGGDFNQMFSNVDGSAYPKINANVWMPANIDVSVFNGFSAVTDASNPTCRSLDKVYTNADKAKFQFYVIDGFLVSDNLEILDVENLNLDFENSDHNPIMIDVKLK